MPSAKKMKLLRLVFKNNKSVRPKRHVRQLVSKLLKKLMINSKRLI